MRNLLSIGRHRVRDAHFRGADRCPLLYTDDFSRLRVEVTGSISDSLRRDAPMVSHSAEPVILLEGPAFIRFSSFRRPLDIENAYSCSFRHFGLLLTARVAVATPFIFSFPIDNTEANELCSAVGTASLNLRDVAQDGAQRITKMADKKVTKKDIVEKNEFELDPQFGTQIVTAAPAGMTVSPVGAVLVAFKGSVVVASRWSSITAQDGSVVFARFESKVIAEHGSKVRGASGASIMAMSGSIVLAEKGCWVTAMPGSTVLANSGAVIIHRGGNVIGIAPVKAKKARKTK